MLAGLLPEDELCLLLARGRLPPEHSEAERDCNEGRSTQIPLNLVVQAGTVTTPVAVSNESGRSAVHFCGPLPEPGRKKV